MKTYPQQKFPVSFYVSIKTVSTSYTVQVVSNDSTCSTQAHLQNAAQTTSVVTWCIWEIKTDVPKQTVPTCHLSLSVRCQPTVSTPSSTVPSVPWRFLFLSLSALQYLNCQAKPNCFRLRSQGYQSVQTSVKPHCSCTLPNLRCSTTHILSHKCGN